MKAKTLFLALPLVLAACSSTSNSIRWVDYGDNPMENPQFMADMMAAGTPGPEHEAMAARAGRWTVEGHWWSAPGADPFPMDASANCETWLEGRYLLEKFYGEFGGMPFEGRLIQGYDNASEEWWCMWIESMATGSSYFRGTEIAPGVVEYRGTAQDPITPAGRPVRMTVSDNRDGGYTMRMYDCRPGVDEFQSMELTYTR